MAARFGHIDCSSGTYVATCSACPTFRGAPQASKAWALADLAAHRRRAHPEQARNAEAQRRIRLRA